MTRLNSCPVANAILSQVYELPPIGSDWGTDISPDATLKSSAASIRSSASKSPVTASLPHFHKPSRLQADHTRHLPLDYTLSVNRDAANGSIASLYSREQFSRSTEHANTGESPPFQKQFPQSVYSLPKSPSLQIHKRQRQAPAFNLAVIGPRKTGKTSFIRALFSRCELAQHPNTVAGEQDLKRIQSFGSTYNGKVKSTDVTESLTVEMLDGRGDRLALTCVDTSGWDNNSLGLFPFHFSRSPVLIPYGFVYVFRRDEG